jgi:uncharacterized protein YjbJ (UPF0337 family)
VNGTIDGVVGSAKQQVGKLTGDTPLRIKGIAQRVKGTLENTLGETKDAIDGASRKAEKRHGTPTTQENTAAQDSCCNDETPR